MNNRVFFPVILSLILILGIILGSFTGSPIKPKPETNEPAKGKIYEIINFINQAYVDTASISYLEESAISNLLQGLDPHSEYIPAMDYNEVNDPLQGQFEGIGVQFRLERDSIIVMNVINGGPSEKAGLHAGDRILFINGNKFFGKDVTNEKVIRNLKGKKGTKVRLSIYRKGNKNLLNFTVTRDIIPTYSVDASYLIKKDIGYIRISKFSATTDSEFLDALLKLKEEGMEKLIIDLRGNSGGYLESAVRVIDELLPEKKLIVYTLGEHRPKKEVFSTSGGNFENEPLVVLIDDWSASASEILAGAIQDNDRGTIIGRRSFGKGLVQEQVTLKDGSAIRLTVARYFTPTGRSIQSPYNNGTQAYYDKFYERFINGEIENPDTNKIHHSKKYKTPKGKIVYDSGGIMPDIYMNVTKKDYPQFYTNVLNKGVIFQFAFDYFDKNDNEVGRYKSYENFVKAFNINDKIYEDFKRYAKNRYNLEEQKDSSKVLVTNMIKATIARNVLNEEAYFKLVNNQDKTVNKAIEVLDRVK